MPKYYKVEEDLNLKLDSSEIITLDLNNSDTNINYDLSNGDYEILIFNNVDNNIAIKETGKIINANVKITYIELNDDDYQQITHIDVYKNSTLDINSIYLGINKKDITFDIYNKEINTIVTINNNVVCLNDSDFSLNVIGNIDKGAKNSKCLQKSQCLTFENPKNAKVLPVLNIDENDVEAAHSLSSGTIDEDVLFYMNARGLTKKQALSLLLVSYLIPNEEFYKTFEKGLDIKNIADKKVEKICSL